MPTAKKEEFTELFGALTNVDVSNHIEEKDTGKVKLKYLSWAWAWYEVRKRCPDATYSIIKNENGLPYFVDPTMGIMVYTTVTIAGETHEMWLPVMDGGNNPMKLEPYEITTKWGSKHVDAATMFDINKTVMRCLTKNLAMFGLGLALYAGEDLFDDSEGNKGVEATRQTSSKTNDITDINQLIAEIDNKVQTMVKTMNKEQKDELAKKIEEKIGMKNYRLCKDTVALNKLLFDLKAA